MREKSSSFYPAIGAVIGAATAFPVAIPLWMTSLLAFEPSPYRQSILIALALVIIPLVPIAGLVIGIGVGALAEKHGVRLYVPGKWAISVAVWTVIILTVVALDVGSVLSPVTLIGLGNTSTAADLWLFTICAGGLGTTLGVLLAVAILVFAGGVCHPTRLKRSGPTRNLTPRAPTTWQCCLTTRWSGPGHGGAII